MNSPSTAILSAAESERLQYNGLPWRMTSCRRLNVEPELLQRLNRHIRRVTNHRRNLLSPPGFPAGSQCRPRGADGTDGLNPELVDEHLHDVLEARPEPGAANGEVKRAELHRLLPVRPSSRASGTAPRVLHCGFQLRMLTVELDVGPGNGRPDCPFVLVPKQRLLARGSHEHLDRRLLHGQIVGMSVKDAGELDFQPERRSAVDLQNDAVARFLPHNARVAAF